VTSPRETAGGSADRTSPALLGRRPHLAPGSAAPCHRSPVGAGKLPAIEVDVGGPHLSRPVLGPAPPKVGPAPRSLYPRLVPLGPIV